MHRLPSWDDLRYFVGVAEYGSLSGAARRLTVNHSTVFRRINALEQSLGVRLFERLPSGYVPTAEAESILDHARRAEQAILELERAVAGRDFQLKGALRITTAANLATEYLAPILPAFLERYPGMEIEVSVSNSDYNLSRREADLALRATTRPPEHLIGRQVSSVPWMVFAGKAYLAHREPPESMAELADHPIVGADSTMQRVPALAWLHRNVPPDRIVATSNDLNTMAALVVSGLGLALLPNDQQRPGLKALFPVEPNFDSTLWLLTHPDLRHTARVSLMMGYLYDALSAHPRLAPISGDHDAA